MAGENTQTTPNPGAQTTPNPGNQQTPATETPATETPAAEIPKPEDEFAAVFSALNTLGDNTPPADLTSKPIEAAAAVQEAAKPKPAAKPAEAPAATTDELPPDDAQQREAAAAEAEAAAAAEAAKKPAPPPAAAEVDDNEILRRLGRLLQQPEPQRQQPQQPQAQTFDFSPEEAEIVSDYEKEWPDVARAEAVKRGREYKLLTQHIFTQVVNMLAPIYEGQRILMDRTQLADLQSTVENYDENLVNDVAEWVRTQPAYLQVAYTHVMQQGTVEEVKDLVDRFRQATGATHKETPASSTPPGGSELPAPAKQAAARLAPVSTKRSAPVQAPSKDDFDGAFAEAAKEA